MAFTLNKGIEGLRCGILVGQFCLLAAYSILIDSLTNWEECWREAQRRLYRDIDDLEDKQVYGAERAAPMTPRYDSNSHKHDRAYSDTGVSDQRLQNGFSQAIEV